MTRDLWNMLLVSLLFIALGIGAIVFVHLTVRTTL